MALKIRLFTFCFMMSVAGHAQVDTVRVGLYVTNLYDFNLVDDCYTAEFWTWAICKDSTMDFNDHQEIMNAKSITTSNQVKQQKKGLVWEQKKYVAVILHDWEISNFPFDKQVLKIGIEDAARDSSSLRYIADVKNSKIRDKLQSDEWRIDSVETREKNVTYNTTYGDPELHGHSTYPGIEMRIEMTRLNSWNIFFKLVTGVYVAFLISLMVFRIDPPNSEGRLGLAVGGLFAAVGNKYIVESIVPTTTFNTFIDNIHNLTFAAILVIVIRIIQIAKFYKEGMEVIAYKKDIRSFWSILVSYIALNILLLIHASYLSNLELHEGWL